MALYEEVYEIKFNTRKAEAGLKRLDKKVDGVGKSVAIVGQKFEHHIAKASVGSVKKLTGQVRILDRSVRKINLSKLSGGLDKVARKLAIVTTAFAGLGAIGVRNALELNKGMANVSTMLNTGANDVHDLKKTVQDMSKETGKTTDDLTEGLYEVLSAFGDTSEAVERLNVATRAGVAGRASTIQSMKLLSAVTKGYGDTSVQALSDTSDFAFKTVEMGQTTYPELAASMGRIVPKAAAMNTSQQDLWGTMATLTGVTGTASEVVTQLVSVYNSFLKPTKEMNKLVKKQGYESATAMVKGMGLYGTMQLLRKETKGEADEIAKFIRRTEGQSAVLALAGGQAETYTEKVQKMGDVSGATDIAYRKQTEGINAQGHSWDRTKQRLVVFSQRMGDKLLPVLGRLMSKLEPVIEYLEKMDDETINSWIALGKWVAIMAVATKGLSGFLGIVQTLGSLKALNTGISGVTTGMGNATTQIGAASKALKGFNALAALAGGYALGTALDEIVFAPARDRVNRYVDDLEDAGYLAQHGRVAKTGTIEEKEAYLKDLKYKRGLLNKETSGGLIGTMGSLLTGGPAKAPSGLVGTMGSLLRSGPDKESGGFVNAVIGGPSPADLKRRALASGRQGEKALTESIATDKRALASGRQGEKALKESIETDKFVRWMKSEKSMYGVSAPKQAESVDNSVTVHITAPGGDPDKIERAVKRAISQSDRGKRQDMRRAARGSASAER